jgi:PAS domain-containing protein
VLFDVVANISIVSLLSSSYPQLFPAFIHSKPMLVALIPSQIAVRNRPNPAFDIGALDSTVALTLCDAAHPDHPIVYCTEYFESLTGYTSSEIIGSNCRFLQSPPSCFPRPSKATEELNRKPKRELKSKISRGEEVQVQLVNYRKDGRKFMNMLTVVPIELVDSDGRLGRYVVGLQADGANVYR